ncbi:mycofactocin-associated electron transfer flavoprotein beta subunit [Thermopolyspora sp. NPDC052614]|uniref:mycofactocin-associated electron transfer flavoprotein beta subunit n=1 Tax=Thermopolyspora sp. NPDC052614 TaxID=3155682 RepID=UPI003411FFAD
MSKDGTAPGAGEGASGPLIVVCLRPADPAARVDPLTGRVGRDVGMLGLPPAEAAALEYGLRVAEVWSGRVLAVTASDASGDDVLRQVAALGVDVLRVPWPGGSAGHGPQRAGSYTDERYVADLAQDERSLAAALAAAIRVAAGGADPGLVLTGDRSADRGTGALPAYLAREFGAAQALGLVRLEAGADHLIAERRLDGGRRERLRVPRPAVCSVEAAGVRLRRAGLPGLLAAGAAAVPLSAVPVAGGVAGVAVGRARPYRPRTRIVPPPVGTTARERLLELTGVLATHEPPTVIGPVGAGEAADALLDFLRRTGHLAADAAATPDTAAPGATAPGTAASGDGDPVLD